MRIPKHWFVVMALALSVGPNLLIMSGFMQIQAIIQNSLNSSSYSTMWISIIANVAFAVFIPMGPIIAHRLGPRQSFCCAVIVAACTFFLSAVSANLFVLGISRAIEGALTGTQLMVLIPLLFMSYPAERRNRVLGLVLATLFGSVSLGAVLGSISQEQDAWRWLFYVCAICSLVALLAQRGIPRHMFAAPSEPSKETPKHRFDTLGVLLLFMLGISTVIALGNVLPDGVSSPLVYIPAATSIVLLLSFVVVELSVPNPILNFKLLKSRRSMMGAVMAIVSNLLMLVAMSGLGFEMKIVGNIPSNALPTVYCGLVVSVAVACVLAASLFDRIGAGPLVLAGSACILWASYRLMVLGSSAPLDELRILLVILASGVGLNFVVGLVTCALGGPLNQLPRTMSVVQFLRVLFYSTIAPISQWFLNESTATNMARDSWGISATNPATLARLNSLVEAYAFAGHSESTAKQLAMNVVASRLQSRAALSSTHHIFFIAFVASACLVVLSCALLCMGKGPSISHKGKH
ncbi:MFS transporter [Alicyclobacillus fastidiosus]|uniref:MFS transporter n=1 Tax=Alicyclobacillus fastidiosus TaxID=392011 RepID=A0ABY6ZDE8_9BACL|nr:MFS transporter [Alicyclobacillus fastidiosus]WAH40857.1 MFS transporter [Alicyclobacillus fastidiosus]GMA62345.1 putative MFS-type transporter YubD [Alicyclobacillus fastidiosus]